VTIYIFATNKNLFKEDVEVEVKKEGIKPSTWRMDVICPNCKAELSVGYKDLGIEVITKERILLPTKRIPYFTVRCSECRKKHHIKPVDIPLIIREAVMDEMDSEVLFIKLYF